MNRIMELRAFVENYSTAPAIDEMPRRSLKDKGIYGPTGAHVIEEIHTPFNLAYITVTTGTTAFQNIVGVTKEEIPARTKASVKALELSGIHRGDKILFTYPPLVNVFPKEALEEYGIMWDFLKVSSRDALILALCEGNYKACIGESSFFRAALEDAKKSGLIEDIPKGLILLTAGTPLDPELTESAQRLAQAQVHDLYGCQEFGWLTLDGIMLRDDITLIQHENSSYFDLIVGGLPTGDRFPVSEKGHICNSQGKVLTYSRIRSQQDYEVTVLKSPVSSVTTVSRLTKTILRIKAKIVRLDENMVLNAPNTVLKIAHYNGNNEIIIEGPERTEMFDSLMNSQLHYQSQSKTDPAWVKAR